MRFNSGQKVVCIKRGEWFSRTYGHVDFPAPSFNEIVTVELHLDTHIYLQEYKFVRDSKTRARWLSKWFEPVVSDEVLEAELSSIEEIIGL